ncbi:MAG: PfkB family carbohydrate kinase [Phycisphaerae bacterium]|jgi:bifunctional ADP-heptose synthase (sugar kinase/adenylyltransferase)/phosphoglycolate phosphatase-like HAD superfamily hydrolase
MNIERAQQILSSINNVSIAVYGDFCLDAYWMMDPKGGETSVETGLKANTVAKHYYTLGGASNIVANIAALKPKSCRVFGVIGEDIFGRELVRQLGQLHVDTAGLVVQKENFDTIVFGKPYISGQEKPRVDFGFFNRRTAETDDLIISNLRKAMKDADVLIFNQQVPGSINNESFIAAANELFNEFRNKLIFIDSRHYSSSFANVYRKTNAVEAARLCGAEARYGDIVTIENTKKYARELYNKTSKAVFITRGSRGLVVAESSGVHEIPGIQLLRKTDTVGCGDTLLATVSLCMAAGVGPLESATIGNFAASVTATKLFQTGTATAEEILEISRDVDYIYQPELADDRRGAKFVQNTDIEICYPTEKITLGKIKHAVFDHDGTISTLRQGWEAIMEPVMIKAMLGERYKTADETTYHRAQVRVREYIDKSTGIETIKQMQALVEMVQEFGLVPQEYILDKWGYKKIYNDALMLMVNDRVARFQRGELNISDFTVKGSLEFLKILKNRGVRLYMASGTDLDDVAKEAKVLGYANLFDGGIYGSVGDSAAFSKKMVIAKIMNEHNLHGSELLVVGDGPVEMRESRKRDGLALGIASNEVQRFGINLEKRTRLIKAGAHFIIPDFSQLKNLENLIFPK